MSEIKTSPKDTAHAIGTISLGADGMWHLHYVGYHRVAFKSYFGSGVESSRNLNKLLKIVGSRLEKAKQVYLDKIQEVETQNAETTVTEIPSEPGL